LKGECRGSRVLAWWKDINNIVFAGEDDRCLAKGIQWKVGCGAKVKFWEDGWKEDGVSLKQKYPTFFSISKQQNQVIQQMGSFFDEGWEWDFKWRRKLFDKLDMVVRFLEDLKVPAFIQNDKMSGFGRRMLWVYIHSHERVQAAHVKSN